VVVLPIITILTFAVIIMDIDYSLEVTIQVAALAYLTIKTHIFVVVAA